MRNWNYVHTEYQEATGDPETIERIQKLNYRFMQYDKNNEIVQYQYHREVYVSLETLLRLRVLIYIYQDLKVIHVTKGQMLMIITDIFRELLELERRCLVHGQLNTKNIIIYIESGTGKFQEKQAVVYFMIKFTNFVQFKGHAQQQLNYDVGIAIEISLKMLSETFKYNIMPKIHEAYIEVFNNFKRNIYSLEEIYQNLTSLQNLYVDIQLQLMKAEVQDNIKLKVNQFDQYVKFISDSMKNNNGGDSYKNQLHHIYLEEVLSKQLFDMKYQSQLSTQFRFICSLLDDHKIIVEATNKYNWLLQIIYKQTKNVVICNEYQKHYEMQFKLLLQKQGMLNNLENLCTLNEKVIYNIHQHTLLFLSTQFDILFGKYHDQFINKECPINSKYIQINKKLWITIIKDLFNIIHTEKVGSQEHLRQLYHDKIHECNNKLKDIQDYHKLKIAQTIESIRNAISKVQKDKIDELVNADYFNGSFTSLDIIISNQSKDFMLNDLNTTIVDNYMAGSIRDYKILTLSRIREYTTEVVNKLK